MTRILKTPLDLENKARAVCVPSKPRLVNTDEIAAEAETHDNTVSSSALKQSKVAAFTSGLLRVLGKGKKSAQSSLNNAGSNSGTQRQTILASSTQVLRLGKGQGVSRARETTEH